MDYCTLDEVKSELDIIDEKSDDILQLMIEVSKVLIDDFCNRAFDTVTTTARYFDGLASPLFIDDLVSIDVNGFKLDQDGDGVYESTLATTDYILYPLNTTPKTMVKISPNSTYGSFASGVKKGVQVTGTWGYGATIHKTVKLSSIIQTCRFFKRKDSAFSDVIGTTELGQLIMYKGLDPDIKIMLTPLIKRNL